MKCEECELYGLSEIKSDGYIVYRFSFEESGHGPSFIKLHKITQQRASDTEAIASQKWTNSFFLVNDRYRSGHSCSIRKVDGNIKC